MSTSPFILDPRLTATPDQIWGILVAAGCDPRESKGEWIRIKAVWRESKAHDASVNIVSGGFRDFGGGGEHGSWRQLLELLGSKGEGVSPAPARRAQDEPKSAGWWLTRGYPLTPIGDLFVEYDLHGKSVQERIRLREIRNRDQKRQRELLARLTAHFAGRLPDLSFDPVQSLPQGSKVMTGNGGRFRLILPILGWNEGDKLGTDGCHVTNLIQQEDGRITKGKPKSFTPAAQARHPDGQHISLFYPGTPDQTMVPEGHAGPLLAFAEGLETTLSGMGIAGTNGIAAIDAGRLERLLDTGPLTEALRKMGAGLIVWADRDPNGAGQKAGARLVAKARANGIPAWLLLPPDSFGAKADWNDVHRRAGLPGARAAATLALENAERELAHWQAQAEAEDAQRKPIASVLSLDRVRPAEGPAPGPVQRMTLADGSAATMDALRDHLRRKTRKGDTPKPGLLETDPGTGKSHALAMLARDMQAHTDKKGVRIITPTIALADEAASKAHGLRRHGRSPDPDDAGHCLIHPEIEPYSEQWRSIVAHKCQACPHGQAAMNIIKGYEPGSRPCPHLLALTEVRKSQVGTCPVAGYEGDPAMDWLEGNPCGIFLDDTSNLADHRMIRPDQIGQWIRAGQWSAQSDRRALPARPKRAELTERIIPELQRLTETVAGHTSEDQSRIDPAEWTMLTQTALDDDLDWMDGKAPEAIHRDCEGEEEIPLRTLKDLAVAIQRGTAWLKKGFLHFAVPTRQLEAIIKGAMVMDATAGLAVQDIVQALGGTTTEARIEQPSLTVRQVLDGGHGKTVCAEQGSQARETVVFETRYQAAIDLYGPKNVCALTHKDFAEAIRARHLGPDGKVLPGWAAIGWWGNHNRGQNDWERKAFLLIWGLPQLSPSVAEREYMAQRQAVIEACAKAGVEVPARWQQEWDGTRAVRWERIPGQDMKAQYEGYANDWIDQWARTWTTAEVVQGIGRLRTTRRHDEPLLAEIHAMLPLAHMYGMEVHEVERGGRTRKEYHQDRKDSQQERAVIGIRTQSLAGQVPSRRKTNETLVKMGLRGIKAEDWSRLLETGSRQEYSSFQSGTTQKPLCSDEDLAAALETLAADASESGRNLQEQSRAWLENGGMLTFAENLAAQVGTVHHGWTTAGRGEGCLTPRRLSS